MLAQRLRRLLHLDSCWVVSGLKSVAEASDISDPLGMIGEAGRASSEEIDQPRRGALLGLKDDGAVAFIGASSSFTAVLILLYSACRTSPCLPWPKILEELVRPKPLYGISCNPCDGHVT